MTRIITVQRRKGDYEIDVGHISSYAPFEDGCQIYLKGGRRIDCFNRLADNNDKRPSIRKLIEQSLPKVKHEINRTSG